MILMNQLWSIFHLLRSRLAMCHSQVVVWDWVVVGVIVNHDKSVVVYKWGIGCVDGAG